ncbi:hypothetical protein B566_EDAN008612, partial [Ephemera danica]
QASGRYKPRTQHCRFLFSQCCRASEVALKFAPIAATIMATTNGDVQKMQDFLDSNQYSQLSISRYERIFGRTFVSTGGVTTTEVLSQKLNLKPGQRVLDVGCGLGGSAFYLASKYGVSVLGLDLSRNMINRAKEYLSMQDEAVKKLVSFDVQDILKVDLPPNSFDAVYSRDAILHIENKEKLFKRLFDWVKPGGELLITDYCRGMPDCGEEFEAYVQKRGYRLLTVPAYGQLLTDAGWENVQDIDNTQEFKDVMLEFSLEDYNELEVGWNKKLRWLANNWHSWGLFIASKPN